VCRPYPVQGIGMGKAGATGAPPLRVAIGTGEMSRLALPTTHRCGYRNSKG
jgi:hypothetical protein